MFSGYYIPKDNFYHRLSPVTKFVLPLVLVTICFFTASPESSFWLIPIALGLLWLAQVPRGVVGAFLRVLYTLVPIITLSWLLLFREGQELFRLGFISITDLGLQRALAMDFRFAAIALFVPLILGTMPQQDLIAAMRKIKIPYLICLIFTMTLRFIPTLMADYEQINQAQMSRGLELEKVNLWQRVQNLVATVIPMLALSIVRVEMISRVVECRGLMVTRGQDKTFYNNPSLKGIDYAIVGTALLSMAVIGVLRYGFGFFVIR